MFRKYESTNISEFNTMEDYNLKKQHNSESHSVESFKNICVVYMDAVKA